MSNSLVFLPLIINDTEVFFKIIFEYVGIDLSILTEQGKCDILI